MKLVKLYNEDPECIGNFNSHNCRKTLEEKLIEIRDDPPENLKLKTLDKYSLKDNLVEILRYLPPKKINENFGEEVLFWGIKKSHYEIKEEQAFLGANEIFEDREKDIENMGLYLWQRFFNSNSQDAFNLWETYHSVNKDFTDNYNLVEKLEDNLRADCKIGKEKLDKYSLEPFKIRSDSIWKEKNWHERVIENYGYFVQLESPASIGLMKNNEPCAFVSFIPTSSKTLLVNAIQGINKRVLEERLTNKTFPQTALSPFYWKNLLFDVAKDFAKENGFSRIGIQSGHNNMWTKPWKDKKIHLPLEKALEIYDVFAESIGLKQGRDKNWYTKI